MIPQTHADMRFLQVVVVPIATSDYATASAEVGICVGMGVLILPGIGPVIIAGPITAALAGGAEASLAGASVGAIVGRGVPKDRALEYRDHVEEGKYLVLARGTTEKLEYAREVLHHEVIESAKHDALLHARG